MDKREWTAAGSVAGLCALGALIVQQTCEYPLKWSKPHGVKGGSAFFVHDCERSIPLIY